MKSIEIKAPAKINIGLNIVEKRKDGFHNLETFFYPLQDLHDTLKISIAEEFSLHTDNEKLAAEPDNLIVQAVRLLEEETKKKINIKIELQKRIPIGAGLGGGSSDAAAVLISLNEMFGFNLDYKKLIGLALKLGSDVPFFIRAKPAVGYSRGEKLVHKEEFIIENPIVVINTGIHISTKEAFSHITPKPSGINYDSIFDSFGNFMRDRALLKNDFEQFVFSKYPEISEIKDILAGCNAIFTMMSGSGSTVYGIFDSMRYARNVREKIKEDHFFFISTHQPW